MRAKKEPEARGKVTNVLLLPEAGKADGEAGGGKARFLRSHSCAVLALVNPSPTLQLNLKTIHKLILTS